MGEGVRLIDADALQRHFEDMQRYEPCAANFSDHRGEPSTNWYCVEDALANAPTVEAIPVEWMIEQRDKEDPGTHIWWMYQAIVEKWQKEQEANSDD